MEYLEKIGEFVFTFIEGYGLTIMRAIAIFVVGLLLVLILAKKVKRAAVKSRQIDNSASTFVTSVVVLVAYVGLGILILTTLGFSTTGLVAAFSSVMLAIALGMQNTLASLTNGILLIFTKPFKAGDYVNVNGTEGTVKEIKLFSVKLVTPDNLTIVVPNSNVLNSTIINYSNMKLRRMDFVVPVAYDEDVDKVKAVVKGVMAADRRISDSPEPFFRLTAYGESSLNFTLRAWAKVEEYWAVRFDLIENVLKALRANNILIPYNQLDVHVVDGKTSVDEKIKEGV